MLWTKGFIKNSPMALNSMTMWHFMNNKYIYVTFRYIVKGWNAKHGIQRNVNYLPRYLRLIINLHMENTAACVFNIEQMQLRWKKGYIRNILKGSGEFFFSSDPFLSTILKTICKHLCSSPVFRQHKHDGYLEHYSLHRFIPKLSSLYPYVMLLSICMVRQDIRPSLARMCCNFVVCST